MIGRKRMSGFPALMSVDEAVKITMKYLSFTTDVEESKLEDAHRMVVSEDIKALFDVPPFDRSAVEGYSVLASDTTSATLTNPVELKLVGRSEAGSKPQDLATIGCGRCAEILTGGPLTPGANAVVMVEHTKRIGNKVMIFRPVAPWHNVSRRGEDFTEGEIIVERGTKLKPWHIGALASTNVTKVPVQRKLKIALLSTGNELKDPGKRLDEGDILNSSKPMLKTLIRDRDCVYIDLGNIPDELGMIKDSIMQGLKLADLVLTTGGTSLGDKDLVPEAVADLGKPGVVVHGISMRPAKPTGVGFIDDKPIFMLSGYPVAALVGFEVLVDPAINHMRRTPSEVKPVVRARLSRRVAAPIGVRSFLRVRLIRSKEGYIAEPLRLTGSGLLSSMTKANGILTILEHVEGYDEGCEVEVTVIQPIDQAYP